ncbi:MAG: F0F1 ATP synthase subunit B [Acidimicrobiales bacterium]|nr:F0F1 ATP synthase subunit B [Acidimicrobiales bacterium]
MAQSANIFVFLELAATGETQEQETHTGSGAATVGEAVSAQETQAVEAKPDNPILPTGLELIYGGASFLVLWALMKFVLTKPILKIMQDRADKVRGDLDAADRARASAEEAIAQYNAALASAKAEATRLIEDARAQGEAKRRELMAAAEADVAAMRAAAAQEVAQAKAAALAELRGEVATIAVDAAKAVIGKDLDLAAQRPIVDDYLSRSGSLN